MSSLVYNVGKEIIYQAFFTGGFTPNLAKFKVALVNASYTPNADHDWTDISSFELSGTGYVDGYGGAGRIACSGLTPVVARDDTNDRATYDFDDAVWVAINAGTAGAAILIHEGTSDDTDTIPLVCFDPANNVTDGSDLTLEIDASGACWI